MKKESIKIALSIGDHNGIGPEIAIKAVQLLNDHPGLELVLIGDERIINFYCHKLNIFIPQGVKIFHVQTLQSLEELEPGKISATAGHATIEYLKAAVSLALSGEVDAILACPHNETAVNSAGIEFNGYPGKLAELTNTPKDQVFIMLIGGDLRITHVTLHLGLREALNKITQELIEKAGAASIQVLNQFGFNNPKLGVFGINPHAGENGLFGIEDRNLTFPAVETLRMRGFNVVDPMGADVLLANRDCDVYLAMYHDQGHIPVKLLYPNKAAALTIGTPVIFSSVAHGTAMDIAGKGCGDPSALVNAAKVLLGMFQ